MPPPAPPVAAIFAIMTKVGVYVVLRLWLLLFGEGAGASARFGGDWLLLGGMATIAFGVDRDAGRRRTWRGWPASRVLVSSGTLLAAIGMGQVGGHRRRAVLPGQLHARPSARSFSWSSWSSAAASRARTCSP